MIAIRLVRSAVFYAMFYSGSVFFVLSAMFVAYWGSGPLLSVCDGWSRYHRLCARLLLGIRVRVEGELPSHGVLVALRHESYFEAIDLPALLHRPAVFAKIELLRIPLWGELGETYGLIGVERDEGASALRAMLRAARRYQNEGRLLAIFPEGTRTPHGSEGPIQSGFAGLYKLLDCPVVPVAVDSGPLYHRWIKYPGTVTYRVGPTIPPGLPRKEAEARTMEAINALNRA